MRRLLERREREGLSYRELARKSGESPQTLSWWSHRLRRERTGRRGRAFVELVAARTSRGAGTESFEVVLASGRRIRFGAGFDEGALARLVALLESGC
jgi:transposase-like protein